MRGFGENAGVFSLKGDWGLPPTSAQMGPLCLACWINYYVMIMSKAGR